MTTKLEAIVNNQIFDLSDKVRVAHISNDGWGLPPIERFSEQGAFQDGTTDLGFRLRPRSIQLVLLLHATDQTDYFNQREWLTYIFAPRSEPLVLRFTYGDKQRLIKCHYVDGLSLNSSDRIAPYSHKVGVQLQADNPLFYTPEDISIPFGIAVTLASFSIPWAIPWGIGASTINERISITYTGTYKAQPIIIIDGPITNAIIRNETTNEKISFQGHTIPADEMYTVDTRYGYRTVKNKAGTIVTQFLSDDSDVATFHIASTLERSDGVNSLLVTGSNTNTATQVYIQYTEHYISL
jgi:hypothetical protein